MAANGETGSRLQWSAAWTVDPGDDLVLSAGADRQVVIDGVDDDLIEHVRRWCDGEPVAAAPGGPLGRVVDRLVELTVLQPCWPTTTVVGVVPIGVSGSHGEAMVDRLIGHLAEHGRLALADSQAPDDAPRLVVRLGAGAVPDLTAVHLGVDLRLHHTVVIGPLVVPGRSACLACLDRRMARRWPPAAVPPTPAVQRWLPAVAALVAIQLERAAGHASTLVNATAAWDLEHGTVVREALYGATGCRVCDRAPRRGAIALPWAAAP
ncbi:MAG: hypothetical protein ACK5OX_01215 [Desertimonas sp.]